MNERIKAFPFRDEDEAICPFHTDGTKNINKAINHLDRFGWPNVQDLDPRIGAGYENGDEVKAAIYTAATPITFELITRTLANKDQYPPFGLSKRGSYDFKLQEYPIISVSSFDGKKPFTQLRDSLISTLSTSFNEVRSSYLGKERMPRVTTIFDAYDNLSYFRTGSGNNLTERGINTGIGSSINLLEVIRPIARRELNPALQNVQTYETIAHKSYALLKDLAADDLSVCIAVLHELQDKKGEITGDAPFNPDYFSLNDKLSLTITPEFIEKFKTKYGVWLGEKKTIGCPVIHSKALYLLWNWEVDIAKSIWTNQLEE